MHRWEEESGRFFISGKKCLDFREYHEKIEKMSTFHDFWGVADVFFFWGGGGESFYGSFGSFENGILTSVCEKMLDACACIYIFIFR